MTDPTYVAVARADELAAEAMMAVQLAGRELLLCRHEEVFYAVENRCSHLDEPLACGRMRNGWIACPAHGARFDLATGEALSGPTETPIATYALRIAGDLIEVAI